ncbi:ABC transporter ATP-binding protein [Pseudalkalibacillus decolorationis]|uniref:ABC transporter ATP-binding protein n=1 Tax=Pseudalkalibacillus decolorationis TaxID=163879 RepID=UPI0021488ADC|nr:ABC transporter ATP-binding protein [Pseudalkalibacillus decolorationis]
MRLTVDRLSTQIGAQRIINDINMEIEQGAFVGVIGPNGSGKSTILKNIYRLLKPDSGVITINDEDIAKMSSREVAQKMAVVSQETAVQFDFSVKEIVFMGRSPHKGWLDPDTDTDRKIVDYALKRVGLNGYSNKSFLSLSGGEKQRVLIARAIAQQANIYILDEPTNHLDIHHQLQVMDIAKNLEITVLAALHDINLAAYYCDKLYVVQNGSIVASGMPEEVLTESLLMEVFRVHSNIEIHTVTGKVHVTFFPETLLRR